MENERVFQTEPVKYIKQKSITIVFGQRDGQKKVKLWGITDEGMRQKINIRYFCDILRKEKQQFWDENETEENLEKWEILGKEKL